MPELQIPTPPEGWFTWGDTLWVSTNPEEDAYWWEQDLWFAYQSKKEGHPRPRWTLDVGCYGDPGYVCRVIGSRPVSDLAEDQEELAWYLGQTEIEKPEDVWPDWACPVAQDRLKTPEEVIEWIARWFERLRTSPAVPDRPPGVHTRFINC